MNDNIKKRDDVNIVVIYMWPMPYVIELGAAPHAHPLLTTPQGVDDEGSDAVRDALSPLGAASKRKSKNWLEYWLNFKTSADDDGEEAFSGSRLQIRRRFRLFLEAHDCILRRSKTPGETALDYVREKGSLKDIQVCVAVVRRFYDGLQFCGAYLEEWGNPLKADGVDDADRRRTRSAKDRFKVPSDSFFRASDEDWSPTKIKNPAQLAASFAAAAEAARWPSTPMTLLHVMIDDGPRSGDVRKAHAADWGRLGFGRALYATNKGADGQRVKFVLMTEATRQMMIDAVEERHRDDPSLPDFATMVEMAKAERWEELERFPLFPSRRGTSISYSGFQKVYFRPTMLAAGITVGDRVAWPHLTRHANITRRVVQVFRTTVPGEHRNAKLDALRRDLSFASDQLGLYAWEVILEESIRSRTQLQDRLNAATHPNDGKLPTRPTAALSPAVAAALARMEN